MLYNFSSAKLYGCSYADVNNKCSVTLHNQASASVYAYGSAILYEYSSVKAYDNSHIRTYDESSAIMNNSSSCILYNDSSAVLYNDSYAEANDNSFIEQHNNSSSKLYHNSSALLCNDSSAELYGYSTASVFDTSICFVYSSKGVKAYNSAIVIEKPGQTGEIKINDDAKHIKQEKSIYTNESFAMRCERIDEKVVLYKVVNHDYCDFYSGKIKYEIGKEVICPDFDPDETRQCGGGLHLSPTVAMAETYNKPGKILKCLVNVDDFVIYQNDITKVRCKKVFVLEEIKKSNS